MKKTIQKTKPAKRGLTDRSHVEQSLRNSEPRYRRLFETSQDGILILDAKTGAIRDVNPYLIAMLGYSCEEFIEKKLWEVGAFKDIEASKDAFEALQINEYIRYENLPLKTKDGRLIQVEFVSNVYLVGEDKVIQCNIRDITEHKRLVAALRENERKYRTLVTQSPDGIFLVDLSGNFSAVNKAICDGLGFSEEELRSMNIWDIVPEQYLDQYKTRLTKILNGEILNEPSEYTVRGKDGKILFIEVLSAPYYSEKGIIGFQGIARDITARKQAEQALRESDERFRELFENANDIVYTHDLVGNFTSVNRAAEQITGYTRAEALMLNIAQVVAPDYLALVSQMTQRKISGGTPTPYQLEILAKDGHRVPLEVSTRLIYREDKPVGVQGIARDITERKRAEAALHESEERYRHLVELLPDGVVVHSEGRVVFANPASARITGAASPAELFGKPVIEFVHPEHRELALKRIKQSLDEARPAPLAEEKFIRFDGTPIDVQVAAIPFSYAGKPAMLTVFDDITERKRAKEQIVRRANEFAALYETTHNLSAQYELSALLQTIADDAVKLLKSNSAAIYFYDSASDELELTVKSGFPFPVGARLKMGAGMAGRVAQSREPQIVDDYKMWKSRSSLYENIPFRAVAEVPMLYGGNLIGVLAVTELGESLRKYNEADLQLLALFASAAAGAVHNARLHDETVRQLDRLEALHSIDIAISASMDLQMTLNILLEHVKTQLNVDAASVLLLNLHSQTLEYAAGRGFRTRRAETAHIRLGENFAGRAALERRVVRIDDPAQIQSSPHFAALWAGEGFAAYFGIPLIVKGQVKGVLEVYHRAPFCPEPDWISFLETLAGQAAIAVESAQLFENLQRSNMDLALAYDATIEGWSRALDLRDKETKGHTLRVTEITMQLAKAMGIGDAELVHVRRGALLHDIGKMSVPDSILFKPGPLTDDEWRVMRLHPQLAYDVVSPISFLRPALDIPYCHHEKWDGSGYPRGLKGEQIPFSARIFAVVDVWDALRSDRPYRLAWPEDKVLEHIRSLAGTHFDPQVAKVCLESGVLGTRAPE